MTTVEMLARIADLEAALRMVIVVWIVTVVLIGLIPDRSCAQCPHCQGLAKTPRCPMCMKRHESTERCP